MTEPCKYEREIGRLEQAVEDLTKTVDAFNNSIGRVSSIAAIKAIGILSGIGVLGILGWVIKAKAFG